MFSGSIPEFLIFMAEAQAAAHEHVQAGLEKSAALVEDTAKGELGTLQPAVGPYNAWEPLAASTEERKARAGAPSDSPLIREGEMQGAFHHKVEGHVATIWNDDHAAVIQELGAGHTPPRPFLGPALYRETKAIEKILGGEFVSAFTHHPL